MIKDCDSPYDGRHEGAARLGQDRHFTGSVSQYHEGCGPLSSFGAPSRSGVRRDQRRKCGHIERTRATVAPLIPLTGGGRAEPWPYAVGAAPFGRRPHRVPLGCRRAGRRGLQSRLNLARPAVDEARWPAGRGPRSLHCVPGLEVSTLGRGACPRRAFPVRFGLRGRGRMVLTTSMAPGEAVGYQPRNWPWLAHSVASEAATAAAITATTSRRTGRSADQRRPRTTTRRVSPITM